MTDLSSLGSLSAILPPDFNAAAGVGSSTDTATKIHQVSKAMEMLFANQLTAELGKEINVDGSDDPGSGANVYGDFIQQAMTKGLTSGHGIGLAKQIENFLTLREHPAAAPYMHPALHPAHPMDLHNAKPVSK
jgi:Rod binding domain-containing protein